MVLKEGAETYSWE